MKTIPRRFRAIIVTAICWAWLSPVLGHAEEKPEFRPALVGGTVVFFAGKEKPHLQIYANQDRAEIAQGNDFIAPQLLFGTENWDSVDAELAVARNHLKNGMVELAFHVDATGKVLHSSVVHEYPPGLNFGDAGLKAFAKARFIPGFRNGKPFECTFQLTEFYHPRLVFVPRYR